jgi:hypothetical protein
MMFDSPVKTAVHVFSVRATSLAVRAAVLAAEQLVNHRTGL